MLQIDEGLEIWKGQRGSGAHPQETGEQEPHLPGPCAMSLLDNTSPAGETGQELIRTEKFLQLWI